MDSGTPERRQRQESVPVERRKGGSEGPTCAHCGCTVSRVVDRHPPKRRRECVECGVRFNTKEERDDAA
jgi:hypothetical protein